MYTKNSAIPCNDIIDCYFSDGSFLLVTGGWTSGKQTEKTELVDLSDSLASFKNLPGMKNKI